MRIYIFFAILGIISMSVVYSKVKKKLFSEKESLFWMLGAILVIISPLFIGILNRVALTVGIDYPPSLLFTLAFIFSLFLIFRLTQLVYVLNERVKELGQVNANLEKEIGDIKEKIEK